MTTRPTNIARKAVPGKRHRGLLHAPAFCHPLISDLQKLIPMGMATTNHTSTRIRPPLGTSLVHLSPKTLKA
jgi:hypothetical protein